MNGNFGEIDWSFIDIISVLSFIIGLENLKLNEQQIRGLDDHLKKQDDNLLAKIIDQNILIIQQNEEIISLLKEKRENGR